MSKICCGVLYDNNDKYCQVCGKEIVETNEEVFKEDESLIEVMNKQSNSSVISQQHDKKPRVKRVEKQKKNGMKICSIMMFSIAVVGLVIMLIGSYLFWINPRYNDYAGAISKYEQNISNAETGL